jgi:hypothetical protein
MWAECIKKSGNIVVWKIHNNKKPDAPGLIWIDLSNYETQPDENWIYDPNEDRFNIPPESIVYRITCNTDKEIISADGQDYVTANVTLYKNDVINNDFDNISWFIPIIGIDGAQKDLLEFILTDGQGSATWSTTNKGIYTVRLDMIRPKTKARLASNVEVIAK